MSSIPLPLADSPVADAAWLIPFHRQGGAACAFVCCGDTVLSLSRAVDHARGVEKGMVMCHHPSGGLERYGSAATIVASLGLRQGTLILGVGAEVCRWYR